MEEEQALFPSLVNNVKLGHKRLGYFYDATLLHMKSMELVYGLPLLEGFLLNCSACQYGKQLRLPFSQTA